jgi:hypothetical protein
MKKQSKYALFILIVIGCGILLTGCIPGDGTNTANNPAGFFWGVWHGWIAPISLIGSLFNPKLRVYEVMNAGWWYDFGFYIAIIGGFGGLSLSRDKKRSKKD